MSSPARSSMPEPIPGGTSERIARVLDAAERVAAAVIDDAERQARLRLEEARLEADRLVEERLAALSGLSDSLVAQAESVRQRLDRLIASLEEVRPDARPTALPTPPRLSAVESAPPVEAAASRDTFSAARVVATQMAVSGAGREEIAARLRTGFRIEDTVPILDAILGPEG